MVITSVAVGRLDAGHLAIGAIGDDVLTLTAAGRCGRPPTR
jgi:hypothetical protein